MLRPLVVRYAAVEGRGKSPKECVRTHTESCDDKHFSKVGLDLSKVGVSPRRNAVEAIFVEGRVVASKKYIRRYKVGGTGSVEGRIISPKECDSLINIRMGHYNIAAHYNISC